MKKQILLLVVFITFTSKTIQAQIEEHPINQVVKQMAENEMFSVRFLRNFLFIKNNIFKQKVIKDMDLSIAKFDDNLNQLTLLLPKDKKLEEKYLKLQNFWNIYRLKITDYEEKNIESIIAKTLQLNKLLSDFQDELIDKIPGYDDYRKQYKNIKKISEYEREIEKIAIVYVLSNGMKLEKIANKHFDTNLGSVKNHLRKLLKNKKIPKELKENYYSDMSETVKNIEVLLNRKAYQPKLMFSYLQTFSNKSFKLMDYFTQNK